MGGRSKVVAARFNCIIKSEYIRLNVRSSLTSAANDYRNEESCSEKEHENEMYQSSEDEQSYVGIGGNF